MRSLIILCALAAVAHADQDTDAIKKAATAEIKVMDNPHDVDFGTIFADDAFAMLPGGYAVGPTAIGKALVCSWTNPEGSYSLKAGTTVAGHQGDVGWATADLKLTEQAMDSPPGTRALRATMLFTRAGTGWKIHALDVSGTQKDGIEDWTSDYEKKEIADDQPPGADAAGAPIAAWLGNTADLAAHMHASGDVVALGSEAGERGNGPAAAKLLASWKKLAFTTAWTRAGGDGKTWAWLAARVSRKAKVNGAIIDDLYWGLFLAVKGAKDWELVSVHYAQSSPSTNGPGCE